MQPAAMTNLHFHDIPARERLRKCGVELPKLVTAVVGNQRQQWWQRTRKAGCFEVARFAQLLASERSGYG